MSWTCQCTTTNGDGTRFCIGCGQPFAYTPAPEPPPPPPPPPLSATTVPAAKSSRNSAGLMLGIVCGVVVLGVMFGTLVAPVLFGNGNETASASADSTASTSSSSPQSAKSAFTEAFDASFKRSCRQSAMRSGGVSEDAADSYCDCALSVLHQTHSMSKVVGSCRSYVAR